MDKSKKVAIIYQNSLNEKAMEFIKYNLEEIFGEYISFSNCYLQSLEPDRLLETDAFLAVGDQIYDQLKEHVKDFNKVIKMNRSPNRGALNKISKIPAGETVLVVNDNYSNTVDTVNSFYEIGVSHINMIPYDSAIEHTGIYDNINIAVTPSEVHLVPKHIKNVIDIGYRNVSFDTMFKLMKMLDLDIGIINRNLFKYMRSLVESNEAFHANYIYGYLKSEMLSHVVNSSKIGMVLVDIYYKVAYANEKAMQIFQVDNKNNIELDKYLLPEFLGSREDTNESITIEGINYRYCKNPITLMDEVAGFYITLENEAEIDLSNKVNKRKGHIAKYNFKDIVHDSKEMRRTLSIAKKIAITDYTVLIRGESGTGKELIAQSIHNASYRSSFPFVAVNCAALPDNLLESELFGYESGAFTGANSKGKIGLFEQANKGTIFLDEIGDMSPNLQVRLLRTIQEQQIMRIGSDRIIDIDVRLIAATNKDLEKAVEKGSFRSDLFFRLNVLPIVISPLRKRKEDIDSLLKYYMGNEYKNILPDDLKKLRAYNWPGNVRELENICTYYKTLMSLPSYISFSDTKHYDGNLSEEQLTCLILDVIHKNTNISHGIGRAAIIQKLKERGIIISDVKLRKFLNDLNASGMIEISKGRAGTRITDKGIKNKNSLM
ncbi:MAG: sigma 54-interacting transcriptional regulator [Clostridiales bacterium]|nr:sigma 54-interacting transcriptional regulator [Clostridiales bacterium]